MPSFQDFGLSRTTLDALAAKNITEPTPIQAEAIPLLLGGTHDVLGQARTGTGKTAAFGIPVIELIRPGGRAPQALVLTAIVIAFAMTAVSIVLAPKERSAA